MRLNDWAEKGALIFKKYFPKYGYKQNTHNMFWTEIIGPTYSGKQCITDRPGLYNKNRNVVNFKSAISCQLESSTNTVKLFFGWNRTQSLRSSPSCRPYTARVLKRLHPVRPRANIASYSSRWQDRGSGASARIRITVNQADWRCIRQTAEMNCSKYVLDRLIIIKSSLDIFIEAATSLAMQDIAEAEHINVVGECASRCCERYARVFNS